MNIRCFCSHGGGTGLILGCGSRLKNGLRVGSSNWWYLGAILRAEDALDGGGGGDAWHIQRR